MISCKAAIWMKLMRLRVVSSTNAVIRFDLRMKDISDCLLVETGKVKMGKGEHTDEHSPTHPYPKSFDELPARGRFRPHHPF